LFVNHEIGNKFFFVSKGKKKKRNQEVEEQVEVIVILVKKVLSINQIKEKLMANFH